MIFFFWNIEIWIHLVEGWAEHGTYKVCFIMILKSVSNFSMRKYHNHLNLWIWLSFVIILLQNLKFIFHHHRPYFLSWIWFHLHPQMRLHLYVYETFSSLLSELLNERFFLNEQDAEKVNVMSLLIFHEILILVDIDGVWKGVKVVRNGLKALLVGLAYKFFIFQILEKFKTHFRIIFKHFF